jgi:hypothetical protein
MKGLVTIQLHEDEAGGVHVRVDPPLESVPTMEWSAVHVVAALAMRAMRLLQEKDRFQTLEFLTGDRQHDTHPTH